MTAHRILVVDDNPSNTKLLAFLLSRCGYAVAVAASAQDAIDQVQAFRPHLILMDIQLPGMDGLELTRRLKAGGATRHIIIVAATAYAMKGDEERAHAAGCDGYLTKPLNTRTLPATIASYLSQCPVETAGER